MSESYAVSKKNKVRQLNKKASYELQVVHDVLDAGLVAHVGIIQESQPKVVPMIYGRDGQTLFLHGARKARVIRMLEENDEVCVNVTLVDGLVLARSAFNSSMHYRSATIYGKPCLVEDYNEKVEAMRIISEHSMPGRWAELREPLEREVKMTGVIAVNVQTGSAKISAAMPDDEDEDYDIPIWAGVLPLESRFTRLLDDDRLLDGVESSPAVRALQDRQV